MRARRSPRAARPAPAPERWELRLYVAGQSAKSLAAQANLKKLCDQYVPGQYQIKVIDLLAHPELAGRDQILALPTVVRTLPAPPRRVLGDLSDTEQVRRGLGF